MRVRAKFADNKFGFYGSKRRYDGEEFDLDDPKHFSEKWMEKVEEESRGRRRKHHETAEPAQADSFKDIGAE
jgi:hypothetical protein